jgi:ESS family glutamate:Na+ symporter
VEAGRDFVTIGQPLALDALETTTLGLLVYLIGARVTRSVGVLRDFNIPEPVTGGILAALVTLAVFLATGHPVTFDLSVRDYLLVLFFAGIGLNARMSDLATGGHPLLVLIGITVALIVAQDVVGVLTALVFGLPLPVGILLGSASLIGGHGTTIAWAPVVEAATGRDGMMELGIASATLGLIAGAIIGGPVAKALILRHKLAGPAGDHEQTVGLAWADEATARITVPALMHTLLVLHIVILAGMALHEIIVGFGLNLPLFVPCMLVAIVGGNLYAILFPRAPRVARSPTLAMVSDFALGTFLAMSLMSMQLWTLSGMGLLMAVSLAVQVALVIAFILFLVFRLMGADYTAAVLSAGFAGFSLGATPTAIANMTAVTKHYGPAPIAFVILPLVSAFFVDIANAAIIQTFLAAVGP